MKTEEFICGTAFVIMVLLLLEVILSIKMIALKVMSLLHPLGKKKFEYKCPWQFSPLLRQWNSNKLNIIVSQPTRMASLRLNISLSLAVRTDVWECLWMRNNLVSEKSMKRKMNLMSMKVLRRYLLEIAMKPLI